METNRNTFLAIALSLVVLVAWQFLYIGPKMKEERRAAEIQRQQQETAAQQASPQAGGSAAPGSTAQAPLPGATQAPGAAAPSGGVAPAAVLDRQAVLAATPRIAIDTPSLAGSINLKGARIDDLELKNYKVTIAKDSPPVTLLSPSEMKDGYFAEFGWVPSAAGQDAPGPDTVWTARQGASLTPSSPVTLEWTSPSGVVFTRTISVDKDYLFTISDKIENGSGADYTLYPYGRVTRFEKPVSQAAYVLHEGMIGVLGAQGLEQITYKNIEKDREFTTPDKVAGGWLGITDKYWAAAVVPDGVYKPKFSFFDKGRSGYQAEFLADPVTLAPGRDTTTRQLLFAGAKQVDVVNGYEASEHIEEFNLLIDWGWFYFITKPMFWLLDSLFKLVGNFGVAILVATVLIKTLLFPLANMSYRSMGKMKKLQPEMLAIRERYSDDKVKQQQETMALYKREKINPAAGCWPMLVQIPIFFALYKVLYITIEMRHAPFFGWVQDLAAPDPTTIFNLFGLVPFVPPAFLPHLGVWPLIMGVTMFLQMQMNPAPPDPTQAMIFKWMPIVFTFMLASFPAGLVIYWAWNNTLSVIQQGVIMKSQGAKIELWDNLRSLFVRKPKPAE